jgi:hypothetical protein
MNDSIIRYQYNPMLTDTVSFFDLCIPLTNENLHPTADSLQKYYDNSIYNYITPLPPQKQFLETTSVFKPHNLEPKHSEPLAINYQYSNWITIVLLICLFIFAWIQTTSSKRFNQIIRAVVQPHHINQLERDGNIFKERITLGLGLIYYLVTSIFIFLVFTEYNTVPAGMTNIVFTGIVFMGLFVYQFIKSSLIHLSGVIFGTSESARKYQLIILIFNNMIGILLVPVTLIAFYWESAYMLIAGIVIVSLLLSYRVIRGFLTGQDNKSYSLFYLILYLCTLEILPLLLLFKAISKI